MGKGMCAELSMEKEYVQNCQWEKECVLNCQCENEHMLLTPILLQRMRPRLLQEDEAVMQVYEDCRRCRSVEEIRRKYSTCYPNMRVDRVIFVASAADKLPERLISCVQKAARPSHYMTERRGTVLAMVIVMLKVISVLEVLMKMKMLMVCMMCVMIVQMWMMMIECWSDSNGDSGGDVCDRNVTEDDDGSGCNLCDGSGDMDDDDDDVGDGVQRGR